MMCMSFLFVPSPATSGLVRLILAVINHPDHRQAFEIRKRGLKLKHLGDPPSDTCIAEFRDVCSKELDSGS